MPHDDPNTKDFYDKMYSGAWETAGTSVSYEYEDAARQMGDTDPIALDEEWVCFPGNQIR